MGGEHAAALGLPQLVAASTRRVRGAGARAGPGARAPAALRRTARAATSRRAPLFDTARFARHLETAYAPMWQASSRARAAPIAVPALPGGRALPSGHRLTFESVARGAGAEWSSVRDGEQALRLPPLNSSTSGRRASPRRVEQAHQRRGRRRARGSARGRPRARPCSAGRGRDGRRKLRSWTS